jgi:hypothetical protein
LNLASTFIKRIFDYAMNTLNWGRRRLDKEAVALRPDAGHDAKFVRMKLQVAAMRRGQPFSLPSALVEAVPRIGLPGRITA